MAGNQNTTIKRGMAYEEGLRCDYYSGTKDELLGTGKFRPEWFPGDGANKKTCMTYDGEALHRLSGVPPEIAYLQIYRKDATRKTFYVRARVSEDEQNRRRYKADMALLAQEKEKALALARGWIDGLPDSIESFKKGGARYVEGWNRILADGLVGRRGGYSFEKTTMEKFNQAVQSLVEIIMNGEVEFSPLIHDQRRSELAREAFDRHVAGFLPVSDRESEYQHFKCLELAR